MKYRDTPGWLTFIFWTVLLWTIYRISSLITGYYENDGFYSFFIPGVAGLLGLSVTGFIFHKLWHLCWDIQDGIPAILRVLIPAASASVLVYYGLTEKWSVLPFTEMRVQRPLLYFWDSGAILFFFYTLANLFDITYNKKKENKGFIELFFSGIMLVILAVLLLIIAGGLSAGLFQYIKNSRFNLILTAAALILFYPGFFLPLKLVLKAVSGGKLRFDNVLVRTADGISAASLLWLIGLGISMTAFGGESGGTSHGILLVNGVATSSGSANTPYILVRLLILFIAAFIHMTAASGIVKKLHPLKSGNRDEKEDLNLSSSDSLFLIKPAEKESNSETRIQHHKLLTALAFLLLAILTMITLGSLKYSAHSGNYLNWALLGDSLMDFYEQIFRKAASAAGLTFKFMGP